jgi:hypothetical protein
MMANVDAAQIPEIGCNRQHTHIIAVIERARRLGGKLQRCPFVATGGEPEHPGIDARLLCPRAQRRCAGGRGGLGCLRKPLLRGRIAAAQRQRREQRSSAHTKVHQRNVPTTAASIERVLDILVARAHDRFAKAAEG